MGGSYFNIVKLIDIQRVFAVSPTTPTPKVVVHVQRILNLTNTWVYNISLEILWC